MGNNCVRRAYLSERIAERRPIHHSAVMGNIMHKVMQVEEIRLWTALCDILCFSKDCLKRYVPYRGQSIDMQDIIRQTIDSSGLSLFESDKTEIDAQEFVNSRMVFLHQWLTEFASSKSHFSLFSAN